jgi:hypothetical protein
VRPHAPDALPQSKANKRKRGAAATIAWPVCKRCGLVYLKNHATEREASRPCSGLDDS